MKNQYFSFIHCADLHLDSPFEGIHNISGWLYFKNYSSFDIGQIDVKNRLWFKVVNPSNIVEELKNYDSNEFLFRKNEIILIIISRGHNFSHLGNFNSFKFK